MSKQIEIILSPSLYDTRVVRQDYVSVAVDVLRATTSMCAAFSAGVEEIVPLDSLDELAGYAQRGYLLAAERGGKKVMGAECGNSPTEYLAMNLGGKRLAYSTTNGTRCVRLASAGADRTFVGCFSNLSALAQKVAGCDVVVLCSGWNGRPSLEDTLMAGALADRLSAQGYRFADDAAAMAANAWRQARGSLWDSCQQASHLHRLMAMGCRNDIDFCLRADTLSVVPEYKESVIKKKHETHAAQRNS